MARRSNPIVIFDRLEKLGLFEVTMPEDGYIHVENDPYMPLSIERLPHLDRGGWRGYSIAHRYLQNGDLVPDPDMEILVSQTDRVVRPVSWRSPWMVKEAEFRRPDGSIAINPSELREQTSFLAMWTKNLLDQGFHITAADIVLPEAA